jgi:WhiB family redox-sensing transcriptional regulator
MRPPWDLEDGWQTRAQCRGQDASVFFSPPHLEKRDERELREAQAKAICSGCPVVMDCRDFALFTREPHGIWGGLNEIERRHLLLNRRAG